MSEAVFLHGVRDVRVGPYSLREGRPGEALIDVAAVGICGSDLHYYKDGGIGGATVGGGFVPGHEFGGALCEDFPELGLKRGALVAVDPNGACGHCEWCREGYGNLCPNVAFIGAPPFDGAMTSGSGFRSRSSSPLPETSTRSTPPCSNRSASPSTPSISPSPPARARRACSARADRPPHPPGAEGRGRRPLDVIEPLGTGGRRARSRGAGRVVSVADSSPRTRAGDPW